jgi:hypothetical protein
LNVAKTGTIFNNERYAIGRVPAFQKYSVTDEAFEVDHDFEGALLASVEEAFEVDEDFEAALLAL